MFWKYEANRMVRSKVTRSPTLIFRYFVVFVVKGLVCTCHLGVRQCPIYWNLFQIFLKKKKVAILIFYMVSYQKSENHKLGVFSVLIRGLQAKMYQDSVQKFWKNKNSCNLIFEHNFISKKSKWQIRGIFGYT